MSLLPDARRKIELAEVQTDAYRKDLYSPSELPGYKSQPAHAASASISQRAAKPALVQGNVRLGIIPIALISGAAIAAGWGFYVWHETNPPVQALQQPPKQPPVVPIVSVAPSVQPVSGAAAQENITAAKAPASFPAPIPLAASMQAAFKEKTAKAATKQPSILPKQKPRPSPDAGTKESKTLPADAGQAMSIEHGQRQNGINPTLLAAWQAYRRGDFDLARQHYSDILKQDVKSRDAMLGMAAIAQQQGQDDVAIHYYRKALALDPRDSAAHAGLLSLLGPGYEAGNESRLMQLLEQQPKSAALSFAIGNMFAAQLRWSDAQPFYFSASNLEPDNAQYAFNLAVSLDHMGKSRLAAQHYQRALELDNTVTFGIDRRQIQKRLDVLMAAH